MENLYTETTENQMNGNERLTLAIRLAKLHGIIRSQNDLIDRYSDLTGKSLDDGNLSHFKKDKPIPDHLIGPLAEILQVRPEWLGCEDDFMTAEDYSDHVKNGNPEKDLTDRRMADMFSAFGYATMVDSYDWKSGTREDPHHKDTVEIWSPRVPGKNTGKVYHVDYSEWRKMIHNMEMYCQMMVNAYLLTSQNEVGTIEWSEDDQDDPYKEITYKKDVVDRVERTMFRDPMIMSLPPADQIAFQITGRLFCGGPSVAKNVNTNMISSPSGDAPGWEDLADQIADHLLLTSDLIVAFGQYARSLRADIYNVLDTLSWYVRDEILPSIDKIKAAGSGRNKQKKEGRPGRDQS